MAVQQLTQPIINPIAAFDSTKGAVVTFVVIGGAQVIGNRLIISDNQSGKQIYNQTQSTMKLEHAIPAGILSNGRYYNAVVRTIDNSGAESVASTAVPFYCYSQPSLTIDNIPTSETIENGTYKFVGSYLQSEGEALNSYQFTLYDSNKEVLSQTPLIYYETDSSLAYTFVGMSNDTSYYVSLTGETVNGTQITSGLKYFTVRYLQPASFAICDLVNDCDNGFIQISSNIVAIDGKSNPEPPIYIDNKEVDLRDPDSWVRWDEGFSIKNDFTMRVWGRDFTPYENIITLSNNLNSNNNPNKIEMKWMIGDTIKKLPSYSDADGYNVHLSNSKESPISNLSIKGETRQKVDNGRVINKGEGYVTLNPASGKNLFDESYYSNKTLYKDGGIYFTAVEMPDSFKTKFYGSGFLKGTDKDLVFGFSTSTSAIPNRILGANHVLNKNVEYDFTNADKVYFVIGNGNRINIDTDIDTIFSNYNIMVTTTEATSYEPFGYIPSNDFPCNISIIPGGNSIQETREESKSTVKGTEVTVNDTYINNQTKFNIDGNSYQETTEGYNLFDKSTANIGKVLNAQGELQGDSGGGFSTSDYIQIEPNTNYYLYNVLPSYYVRTCGIYDDNKGFIKAVELSGSNVGNLLILTPANAKYIRITYKTSDVDTVQVTKGTNLLPYEPYTGKMPSPSPDYPQEIINVGGYDNLFDKNNIISGSYVSDGNGAFVSNSTSKRTDYIEIQASSYYYIYSDKTIGNWGAWYDKDKNFISGITLGGQKEGTVNSPANAKYMAFTISYQGNLTDYSNIKINETAIKIKHSGKNWFDNTKVSPIVLLSYSNGIYSASDNDTNTTLGYKIQQYDSNRKFISSAGEVKQNINKPGIYYFTAQKYTTTKYLRIANSGKIYEFNLYYPLDDINVGDYYTVVINIIDTTIGASKFKDVMLLKGKITSASYEPYHEPIITPINLQGNILSKVGEVKDILKINRNGEVEIKKNTGKVVLDGSENGWGIKEDGTNRRRFDIPTIKLNLNNVDDMSLKTSTHFLYQRLNANNWGKFYLSKNWLVLNDNDNIIQSLDDFKTWLSTHNTEVYYELATPQIITLPSISPIELWQGTNIFSLITNLDTEIELEYNYIPQSPSPEAPSEIRNVGDNINVFNKTAEDFKNGTNYGWAKRLTLKLKPNTLYTCSSNDETPIGKNTNLLFGGALTGTYAVNKSTPRTYSTNNNGEIDIYLRATVIDDFFQKYYIKIEIGDTPTDYSPYGLGNISTVISAEHQERNINFPLTENQLLYSGSELTVNGIYNTRKRLIVDGTESGMVTYPVVNPETGNTTFSIPNAYALDVHKMVSSSLKDETPLLCNQLKQATVTVGYKSFDNQIGYWADTSAAFVVGMSTSKVGKTADSILEYFKTNPLVIEYVTNSPYVTKYTDEQSEVFKELFNVQTYLGQNNIFNLGSVPALLTAKTVETPTPITPSKVYSLGDIKNLIDALDKNVFYNQGYSDLITTNFKLKPNYIYTFSFEYEINDATTDLYYSVGYGIDNNYENSIVENLQYQNQTKGKNIVTFIVPKDIPSDKYLYFKIVQTEILANVDVNIFNIQLESGKVATEFQKNGLYNIYPTSTNKNIYNHNTPLYIKSNNIIYSELQNGYNITPTSTSEKTSLAIGYKGVLNEGDTYTISYQQMGQFDYFNLYITDKESQIPVRKLEVNNGTFVMPEGVYDLQLEFGVENSSLNNSLEIWNVQIEANDKATEYELHEENSSVITLDESINGFTAKKDLICLNSPNLLNNNTQSVIVKGDTPYYLNQKGNTTYHIWYYNSDGNLITFIDKEGHEASGVVGEQGYFTTHKDCVKLTITKTANPDLHDVSSEEILSNEVMISKGDSEQLYYPYLDSPSLVRNTNYIEFNGNENWIKRENNNHTFTLSIAPKIAREGICSHYPSFTAPAQIDTQNGIYLLYTGTIIITDMRYDTLEDFKAFLVEQYRNGTPVTAVYWLNEGTTTQLTDDQTNALKSLTTYELMSNVFTNNQIKGESSFSYVSDITEQQTENAYVQLKCYNMNKIPYYIHSNYIDIPEDKSKVFIWLRRKNNLFDLKIEDLGDYSGDEPGDKNKPKVSLDIDMKDVTSTEIPVIAHSIDETGLKTVRFSKDNGESWDEVITVDGLSSTNSYTFEGLTPGTTYPIRVEAIDISGNIGGITQEVTTKVV